MASTVSDEKAGNEDYQQGHMGLIFREGFSFSGFERNGLFLNLEGKRFKDVSGASGIDSILDGRTVVLADFDNDGDQDAFVTTIQDQAHLFYRNNVGQENNFIRIELEGSVSGKDALGALVKVKTSQGVQTQVRSAGSGFMAFHDPRLIFGLGKNIEAEWIEVLWPSGFKERFGPVKANTSLRLVERADRLETTPSPPLRLPNPLAADEKLWKKLRIRKGAPMPALRLFSLAGGEATPLKTGKSYLLNFWATYCGPCRREMPELQRLYPELRDRGIELIGISLDETSQGVEDFAKKLGVTYPLYRTDLSSLEQIFASGPAAIPFSILVDESGQISDFFEGWSPESEKRIKGLVR